MSDSLPLEQGVRLSVLHATWDALHVGELDSWDLIRCAHWVHTGQDMPSAHPLKDPFDRSTETFRPDSATWNANPNRPEVHSPVSWTVETP